MSARKWTRSCSKVGRSRREEKEGEKVNSGHDTTSASMGWTLWCIAHNPDVQKKVIAEVDQIFGSSDRDCTNDDLKQMKYLEKCLKESLRMFPSVPFFARKVEKDVVISELSNVISQLSMF